MKSYRVVFTPEAEEQLAELYRYVADNASPEIAQRYTGAVITFCEGMRSIPHRGTRRDDIRPGLRITNYRRRTVIAFAIDADQVSIIGVFYCGRDYETVLRPAPDD